MSLHCSRRSRAGELLRPDPDVPNFLDLSRALGAACGVRGLTLSANARAIADRLEEHEHIVFVLADGLGLDMIEQGGDSANVLRAHLSMELRAIFPASTVVALTTLMTGRVAGAARGHRLVDAPRGDRRPGDGPPLRAAQRRPLAVRPRIAAGAGLPAPVRRRRG